MYVSSLSSICKLISSSNIPLMPVLNQKTLSLSTVWTSLQCIPTLKNIRGQTHHIIVVDHHQLYIFGLSLDGGLADEPFGPPQASCLMLLLLRPGLVWRVALYWSDFLLVVLDTVCAEERSRAQRTLVSQTTKKK